ncbi:hypothetical protein [Acidovorax sp. sic0104]|uniref:hypothetical protein n=1 Tax=Acidovorax sp. sic0104 TaxID=2854784 RepID=UPI001C4406E3|nr:hypothetical protein [Acidovorax sp. sic0104]MBV7542220.1 hypothetical protein [Acidovorax sp. sic0104]
MAVVKKIAPTGNTNSTPRAKVFLEKLAHDKGKRLLVDLDREGNAALIELVARGYGATNREVVNKALKAACEAGNPKAKKASTK